MNNDRKDVEFKTVDGLTLRGWLYPAAQKGAAIIMTPGFNMTKDLFVMETAEYYHAAGFTILLYDPRSIGASDGIPRNEINPTYNMQDYHDALTFLKAHPLVDPSRIAFWGYSFSGIIALCAAALDKRAKAVVSVSPLTVWEYTKWVKVLSKAMKERESLLVGNQPVYLPMISQVTNESPVGFGAGLITDNAFIMINKAAETHPTFVPKTTLTSFYHIAAFRPLGLMKFVSPTPVLVVAGEKDSISPIEMQKELLFDKFNAPKQFLAIPNKGHMDVMTGKDATWVLDKQIAWLREMTG